MSQRANTVSILETSSLTQVISVCFENHTYTEWRSAVSLMLQCAVHMLTTGLQTGITRTFMCVQVSQSVSQADSFVGKL
jgi:hypothetical protein